MEQHCKVIPVPGPPIRIQRWANHYGKMTGNWTGNAMVNEDIRNIIWNKRAEMEIIFAKIYSKYKDLEQFCDENKNIYKKIKVLASKLKILTDSFDKEFQGLLTEALRNEVELKRILAIATGHAKMSLRMIQSIMLIP